MWGLKLRGLPKVWIKAKKPGFFLRLYILTFFLIFMPDEIGGLRKDVINKLKSSYFYEIENEAPLKFKSIV